jgi:DNA-binding protein
MTDDIVTRLNNDAERCFITEVVRNYADAVDEIEHLRNRLQSYIDACNHCVICQHRGVRGED